MKTLKRKQIRVTLICKSLFLNKKIVTKAKKEIIRGLPSRKVEPNKEDIKKIKSDQKKIRLVKNFHFTLCLIQKKMS